MTNSADAVIRLAGVSKIYGGDVPVAALEDVNLEIRLGELLAIVGPSGSGKSTLLHIIGALDRPTAGTVEFDGRDLSGMSDSEISALRGEGIGFVFQQFFLIDGLSALQNVAHALVYRGVPPRMRNSLAATALEKVGLGARLHHKPSRLSGGERQRVAVARAVVGSPKLLLADEPTGNLDTGTGNDLIELLRDLNGEGSTIAVITHDARVADAMSRKVEIRDGRIVADVSKTETC